MFIRVIDGTWPVGFHGQFAARTASSRNEITLIQFNGDGVTTRGGSDGNMIHLRHVVSVETLGELVVSFKAWKGDTEEMEGHVKFNPEMSGRSCGYLKVGPCNVGALVVWSRMRPVCEELMSDSQMCVWIQS